MLVVEEHAFLQEVQLDTVCWAGFGVVGFGADFPTGGRFLKLKLVEKAEDRRHTT